MAHIKTKDPFGFVGSHVIYQRENAATASNASLRAGSFSGFGGAMGSSATTAAERGSDIQEEHGWITRYDTRLDNYTLFIPGKGASVHSRGDVMKLIADPSFLVQNDDDDEFPAPIEDPTSRYVDVPITKAIVGLGTSGAISANGSVNGVVKCYLPFADVYKVVYEDGTSDEVSEDTIINSMISMLKTQRDTLMTPAVTATPAAANNEKSKKRKRGVDALALPTPTPMSISHAMLTTPPVTVRSVSAPVVSVTVPPPSMMPVSYAAALGMDSSPVVTHSNILELVAARNNCTNGNGNSSSTPTTAPAQVAAIPSPALPSSLPTPRIPPLASVSAAKPFIKNEPSSYSRNSSSSGRDNITMLIDDEPDVEMIPLDADDDVIVPVASSSASSMAPCVASWDFDSSDSWPMVAASSGQPPPSYLITEEPSQVVEPLETRNLAYKYVREELLNLLDRKEASTKKIAMQYDILQNPDIKNISSIKRFTEASGLVVLNHLISTYLAEHEYKSRDADMLLLLKVVAMLPMPARKHVADSKIALTIGKLAKPRSHELYPKLPLAITHLAKWIKRKWTEHFRKQENQEKTQQRSSASSSSKSGQPSQRLGTRTAPPGSTGQRSSNPVEIPDRLVDTQPIPRLASRPALAGPPDVVARPITDAMGNPIATRSSNLSLPLSNGGTSTGRKSSLKPDWMRQQEALRRTRFTSESSQDSTAEYNHYKRIRRTSPSSSSAQPQTGSSNSNSSNSSGSSGTNSAGGASSSAYNSLYFAENEQPESAGGSRGTFGRSQKLSFSSRWSVAEFHRDAPPSSVRPTNRYQHQSPRHVRPRSILRRESKYQGTLDSIR